VDQRAVFGVEALLHQRRQSFDVARSAFDRAETGIARGRRRRIAHAERFEVAVLLRMRKSAHAVGRGEQHGLHARKIERRRIVHNNVEQGGHHSVVPAHGKGDRKQISLAAWPRDQDLQAALGPRHWK